MKTRLFVVFIGMGPSYVRKEVGQTELPELAVGGSEGGEGCDVVAGADGREVFDDGEDFVRLKGHGLMMRTDN